MLEEFEERIENAKNKQFRILNRFHIGDTVYPFWLKNFIVYGTVIDIDTVARKIICDFNGVRRQFCPEDLMLVNPNLVQASKSKKASKRETQLSPDTDNGINAICKECGGQIAVSYDEKNATTDFVCTSCGKRIPESKLSQKSKKAMRRMAFKEESIIDSMTKLIAQIMMKSGDLNKYKSQIENAIEKAGDKNEKTGSLLESLYSAVKSNSSLLSKEKYYIKFVAGIKDVYDNFIRTKNYDEVIERLTAINEKNNKVLESLSKVKEELLKIVGSFN